jgi:hypothetical protein
MKKISNKIVFGKKRIANIISVFIELFYNRTAFRFSLIIKPAMRTLLVTKCHQLIASEGVSRHSATQSTVQSVIKPLTKGHKKRTNYLL